MGTSKSSGGSPSGVPIVPPWVDDADTPDDDAPQQENEADQESQVLPPQIAPPGRFRTTRISLGKFAESGERDALRKGVGRYVKTGMGGSGTAARRLAGTAGTARSLFGALSAAGDESRLDRDLLAGKTARQVINAVVELVCPTNGSLDTEAARAAVNDALSLLLERYPAANLLELTDEQRDFAIVQYVAHDVYRHFVLDVGLTIQEKAPSAATGQRRLKEAREYIRETVVEQFRALPTPLSSSSLTRIVKSVLRKACEVFEEYAE